MLCLSGVIVTTKKVLADVCVDCFMKQLFPIEHLYRILNKRIKRISI